MKPIEILFPDHQAKINRGECTFCGKKVGDLRDRLSIKEWMISGMCQECQDSVFDEDEEDEEI